MKSWRVTIEGREHTDTFLLGAGITALMALLAFWSGDWTRFAIEFSYAICFVGVLIWPLLVMGRHRRRQDRILDKIRAAYLLATGNLMAGQEREARRRLQAIRRLERLWRYGASYPYRFALLSYVITTNMAIAAVLLVLYYHLNSHMNPKNLMETVLFLWSDPWLLGFTAILAIIYGLPPFFDAAQIKSRPWAEFYGDRLQAALKAGRGVESAPQHERPQLPPEGVSARELLGLNPGFTKAELRRAWLRLARELHPDGWTSVGEGVRRMKEAALKRVNAARDELVAQAA